MAAGTRSPWDPLYGFIVRTNLRKGLTWLEFHHGGAVGHIASIGSAQLALFYSVWVPKPENQLPTLRLCLPPQLIQYRHAQRFVS